MSSNFEIFIKNVVRIIDTRLTMFICCVFLNYTVNTLKNILGYFLEECFKFNKSFFKKNVRIHEKL